MRSNYWSCTKFADWLRGTGKPPYGTSEEWTQWKVNAKANKFRYWLAEEFLDDLQDVIMWPSDTLYSIKYWLCNRFVTKTHTLTSSTLKPGQWHEFDTRMFYCVFDTLVDFVEIEIAWGHIHWDEDAYKKYAPPLHGVGYFRTRTWRCPEAAIENLNWQASLTYDACHYGDNLSNELRGHFTPQAIAAQEILALYNWYKNVFPNRPDPYDVSGYNEISALGDDEDFFTSLNKPMSPEYRKSLKRGQELEDEYTNEDTEMLCRLIKIRSSLWT